MMLVKEDRFGLLPSIDIKHILIALYLSSQERFDDARVTKKKSNLTDFCWKYAHFRPKIVGMCDLDLFFF